MRHVHVLAIGGTIASRADDPAICTTYAPVLGAADLIASLPHPETVAQVPGEDFFKIDSASLTAGHWLQLARRVTELLSGDVDGVVVTHGTDTMEETAYFLNLTVRSRKPVILTGAMRPASAVSADGPINLLQAVQAAASEKTVGFGAMILMNGTLIAARDRLGRLPVLVGKSKDGYCVAFESFSYQKLGYKDYKELGPNEIVEITYDKVTTVKEPGKEMRICSFFVDSV